MRNNLLVVTLAALLAAPTLTAAATPGWCSGARCGGQDGVWWQHLPAAAKLPVVQGMIASYEDGFDLGQFYEYSTYLGIYDNDADQKRETAFINRFRTSPQNQVPAFSKSAAAYVAAIDRFYARYPAKRPLDVSEVLRCLSDKAAFSCDTIGKSVVLPWPTGP